MAKSMSEILKDAGLEGSEEALKQALPDLIDLFAEKAAESENKIDDLIAPFLVQFKPQLLELLEKINSKD
jgi:hypothetical protein